MDKTGNKESRHISGGWKVKEGNAADLGKHVQGDGAHRRGQQGNQPEPFRGWEGSVAGTRVGAGDHRGEVGGWRWCMAEHLHMG